MLRGLYAYDGVAEVKAFRFGWVIHHRHDHVLYVLKSLIDFFFLFFLELGLCVFF